jgi:hypothetical protein
MKSLAVLFLAFPLSTFAADWVVGGLQLDYANGAGTARAASARFQLDGQNYAFTDADFELRWGADQLVIERPAEGFAYGLEAPFLKDVMSASARDFAFEAIPGKVGLAASAANLVNAGETTRLSRLSLDCRGSAVAVEPVDACLQYTRFLLGSVSSSKKRRVDVGDIKLNINAGKATFEARIGGIGKVNGEGSATHDAANKIISIRVSKVKYGLIDITGQFFSELEKNESETLVVQRPFVHVHYAK